MPEDPQTRDAARTHPAPVPVPATVPALHAADAPRLTVGQGSGADPGDDGETGPPRDHLPIAVLVKAFRVLEAMVQIGQAAPLRDIARATALPKGTLYRILQTLCSLGYVSQVAESGHYHPTSHLSYLGRNAQQDDIKLLVMPNMRKLHERFNETVNLGVLEGIHVYYVAVLEANRALSWRVATGTRDLYYSTALGRAIVAHMSPASRAAVVAQTALRSRTARTVMSRAELDAILDEARARGTALDHEENDEGVVCIGTPVFLDDRVVAAVSVSIPAIRHSAALEAEVAQAMAELDFRFQTQRQSHRG